MIQARLAGVVTITMDEGDVQVDGGSSMLRSAITEAAHFVLDTEPVGPSIPDAEVYLMGKIAEHCGLLPIEILNQDHPSRLDYQPGVIY